MDKTLRKKMGDWGEMETEKLLRENGFVNIIDLNNEVKYNFPVFDFYAERGGKSYVFTVKVRHKYQPSDGLVNPQYNIVGESTGLRKFGKAIKLLAERFPNRDFEMYWITCPVKLDEKEQTFYYGRLDSILGWKTLMEGKNAYVGVKMKDKYLIKYEVLGQTEWT